MSIQSDSTITGHGHPPVPFVPPIPPLETGDCLSRAEFERRYTAMPKLKKAELIEGVVYVPSPVGDPHASAHLQLITWLGTYAFQTPTVRATDNGTVRLDLRNEVQPDALMRMIEGGQSRIGPESYVEGAPEFTAEVASSTVSRDLHAKFNLYLRAGVREYLVWRVQDQDVDWFRLENDEYQRLVADSSGVFRSVEFPGLWLDRDALLRGDMAQVLAVLAQGLASPEHAAFLSR